MARVKKDEQHEIFKTIREKANSLNETNDCGVIAAAIAFERPYEEALAVFKRAGRQPRKGVHYHHIDEVAKYFSRNSDTRVRKLDATDCHMLLDKVHANSLTFNNIVKALRKDRNYMIIGRTHMVGCTKGRIADWSEGTRSKVENVYEVIL